MGWKQDRAFDPKKMGTAKNMCLRNCRIAFVPEIPPKYNDAKSAMLANKKAGTLHDMKSRPTNCAVPVFADTTSKYEHVMVYDHNTLYSDGKVVSNPNSFKYFGWGETLNGVRVVSYVEEPKPTPTPAPEPAGFKEGDIVVPTRLVDYNGTPLVQYDKTYVITQLRGDRAVLSADRNGKMVVWAAMNTKDIRKA